MRGGQGREERNFPRKCLQLKQAGRGRGSPVRILRASRGTCGVPSPPLSWRQSRRERAHPPQHSQNPCHTEESIQCCCVCFWGRRPRSEQGRDTQVMRLRSCLHFICLLSPQTVRGNHGVSATRWEIGPESSSGPEPSLLTGLGQLFTGAGPGPGRAGAPGVCAPPSPLRRVGVSRKCPLPQVRQGALPG